MTIKHALLAFLDRDPIYGYKLHGLMEEALGNSWSVNTGQIYSTLSRLERDGLVERQSSKSSLEDSDRIVYEITMQGKNELLRWFRDPLSREDRLRDTMYTKFVLSSLSGSAELGEILQIQRRKLLSEMHDLTRMRSEADPKTELHWLLLLESAIMHLEADLRWLDICESRLEELNNEPILQYEARPRGRPPKEERKTEQHWRKSK